MCRKLQDYGLVIYRPYKGASLTKEGHQLACFVLRRHRLWEVFLVNELGFDDKQSHKIACQLEHATPEALAERLDDFLEFPKANPQGELIPRANGETAKQSLSSLTDLSTGQGGHVVKWDMNKSTQVFLEEQGLRRGADFTIVATTEDSLLIQVKGKHISLAKTLAEAIKVEENEWESQVDDKEYIESDKKKQTPLTNKEKSEMISKTGMQIKLHELKPGQRGIVVHVAGQGAVRRRMMDMGLVPGSEVEVVRVAPLGDPIEFTVKGYSLSLRKSEASNIKVEIPKQ